MSTAESTAEYDVIPGHRVAAPKLPAPRTARLVDVSDLDAGRNRRLVAMTVFGLVWIVACIVVLAWGLAALLT